MVGRLVLHMLKRVPNELTHAETSTIVTTLRVVANPDGRWDTESEAWTR